MNGDSLSNKHYYGVEDSSIEGVEGTYNKVIGVWIGNQFYGLGTDWSNVEPFFKNYDVTYNMGTLTVGERQLPDIPAWEFPGGRWDYLYSDAPFDRNKDFRERKAEINFVDGGMEL